MKCPLVLSRYGLVVVYEYEWHLGIGFLGIFFRDFSRIFLGFFQVFSRFFGSNESRRASWRSLQEVLGFPLS